MSNNPNTPQRPAVPTGPAPRERSTQFPPPVSNPPRPVAPPKPSK